MSANVLKFLIQEEFAASRTYGSVFAKTGESAAALQRIQQAHESAAETLRNYSLAARQFNREDPNDLGGWTTLERGLARLAKFYGTVALHQALYDGEELACRHYRHALREHALPAECQKLIRTELLAQSRDHLCRLQEFLLKRPERADETQIAEGENCLMRWNPARKIRYDLGPWTN
jgi:hypothetical protein